LSINNNQKRNVLWSLCLVKMASATVNVTTPKATATMEMRVDTQKQGQKGGHQKKNAKKRQRYKQRQAARRNEEELGGRLWAAGSGKTGPCSLTVVSVACQTEITWLSFGPQYWEVLGENRTAAMRHQMNLETPSTTTHQEVEESPSSSSSEEPDIVLDTLDLSRWRPAKKSDWEDESGEEWEAPLIRGEGKYPEMVEFSQTTRYRCSEIIRHRWCVRIQSVNITDDLQPGTQNTSW